jgi:predicted nucleic acid-binding protein
MILLDTNVLSEPMRPKPTPCVIRWLDAQPVQDLFLCAVTKAEIELGIFLLPEGKRKDMLIGAAIEMFGEFHGRCFPFDELAATKYAQLVARRTKKGRPISVEDAQIAAVALAHGLILATRNTSDFDQIPGLNLINPWQSQRL